MSSRGRQKVLPAKECLGAALWWNGQGSRQNTLFRVGGLGSAVGLLLGQSVARLLLPCRLLPPHPSESPRRGHVLLLMILHLQTDGGGGQEEGRAGVLGLGSHWAC